MAHHAKVLLTRALALHQAGQWDSAIAVYEKVFQECVKSGNAQDLTEATRRIGYSYQWMGDVELAAEYLDLAYTLADLQGDSSSAARAMNGLATLYQTSGSVAEAERAYSIAGELAAKAGDSLAAADIEQNLGTLANIRGDLPEALNHYQTSLDLYQSIGHELGATLVLNNLGMLYVDLGKLDRAEECLERALEICDRTSDLVSAGAVYVNRAELFLTRGDLDLARASCDQAFELASRLTDFRTKAEALKFYGIIYLRSSRPHLAEIHLRQAIDIASERPAPLIEAESHRELALALRAQDRNREALESLNRAHALFSALQARQDQADVGEHLSRLEGDFLSLVRRWGESIEAKDYYTRGHCQRVADYACVIAERLGLPAAEMVWFRMGALLHDVGKTEVPVSILQKPGKLTDEERRIIEQHTVIGDQMLADIPFPWDIRPMVRSHHERWNGGGYPDGLVGEEIALPARIMRIADIFDALTSSRSYRAPLTPERAREIMRDDYGSFDPILFALFEEVFEEFAAMVELNGTVSHDYEPIMA